MNERPIAAGDLVMVVGTSACGCATRIGGMVGLVVKIELPACVCSDCLERLPEVPRASTTMGDFWIPVRRLKRIDPPTIQDETTTERGVTA